MGSPRNSCADEKMAGSMPADFIRRARAVRIGGSSSMMATLTRSAGGASPLSSYAAFFMRRHWQLEFQGCPALRISYRPQATAVVIDDRSRNAQPDSHATGLG